MLERTDIFEKVRGYLVELFEIPADRITSSTQLREDLDLDSIDAVDLVVRLQEFTGKRISPAEFRSVRTVGDVVDCIHDILAKAPE
jgi:acyl carrier protein